MIKHLESINWSKYFQKVKTTLFFLPEYARSPINKMKRLPDWDWPMAVSLHVIFAAAVGLLAGVLSGNLLQMFLFPFLSALSALTIGFLGATFFYYFSLFYLNRKLDYLRLYVTILLASLPMIALRILLPFGPPVAPAATLIGFSLTCLLCVVGLVENFALDRKLILRVVGSVFAIFFVFWIIGVVTLSKETVELQRGATPEALDILQKELQSDGQGL